MKRDDVISVLRAHETELRSSGIASLSLFGSVARGEDGLNSDVDVVIKLDPGAPSGGFAYFGLLDTLTQRLQTILGSPVDVVTEPIRKDRLRRRIVAAGIRAF